MGWRIRSAYTPPVSLAKILTRAGPPRAPRVERRTRKPLKGLCPARFPGYLLPGLCLCGGVCFLVWLHVVVFNPNPPTTILSVLLCYIPNLEIHEDGVKFSEYLRVTVKPGQAFFFEGRLSRFAQGKSAGYTIPPPGGKRRI